VQVNVTNAGLNVTLNVTTTASHQVARQDIPHFGFPSEVALAGILVLFLPRFKRHRRYFLCFFLLVLTLSLGACGGGGGGGSTGSGGGGNTDPGTAAGTYSFTITTTTGTGASLVTAASQVSVTVN
jgi:hypothetical protein